MKYVISIFIEKWLEIAIRSIFPTIFKKRIMDFFPSEPLTNLLKKVNLGILVYISKIK